MGITLAAIALGSLGMPLAAHIKLPALVGDGMVLQRSVPIPIWGWAAPSEQITIVFNKKTYTTTGGSDGTWSLKMDAQEAGGPYTMKLKGENKISIQDIMIGDVWLCSGQSNMGVRMSDIHNKYPQDIIASNYPYIRQLTIGKDVGYTPQHNLRAGEWVAASPYTIFSFGAVGFYFARDIYNKYKVPIGLINSSWGGTRIEAWISAEGLKDFPALEARRKDLSGKLWLRKEIAVPDPTKALTIDCSYSANLDSVFFNGKLIGKLDSTLKNNRFLVPAALLKAKDNMLAIHVTHTGQIDWTETGVVYGKDMVVVTAAGTAIAQPGDWFYQSALSSEKKDPFPYARILFVQDEPAALYNAMIAPLLPAAIKGVLWYQGESNVGKDQAYRELFPAMIKDWRTKWNLGDFPFLFVQLANFNAAVAEPKSSDWAALREAQRVALKQPNTGMAVIHDIGEAQNIHPTNKRDVGKRLALAAQNITYGDTELEYSGPDYKSMRVARNKIILSFDHIGSGLVARGGTGLKYFAIAGADQVFVWANASIENDEIVVWSDQISAPVAVRYAWADNPEGCNLYNREGLPASSFRTDNWK
ncbi:sialate O-acetylesterase [Pedobacter sp. MC2016-24]|nr:sialate O-acetylesterase [Pedobacter sp. MC2016-24]